MQSEPDESVNVGRAKLGRKVGNRIRKNLLQEPWELYKLNWKVKEVYFLRPTPLSSDYVGSSLSSIIRGYLRIGVKMLYLLGFLRLQVNYQMKQRELLIHRFSNFIESFQQSLWGLHA